MKTKNFYNKFWENGYIIIKNFISKKEIDFIYLQINDLLNISLKRKRETKYNLKAITKKYLELKSKNPKLKSHFYDLTRYCDSLVKMAGSKKILDLSKNLLKSNTVFVDNPQVRIDHPKEKLNLPQHQELNQMSKDVITFWIPLVNINKKNGGLYFRPKTHKLGHVKYNGSDMSAMAGGKKRFKEVENLFKRKDLKKYKSIAPKLKAGDAVIFHTFVFHGTSPNMSKDLRWIYISRYNSIKNNPYLKDHNANLRIPYDADYDLI